MCTELVSPSPKPACRSRRKLKPSSRQLLPQRALWTRCPRWIEVSAVCVRPSVCVHRSSRTQYMPMHITHGRHATRLCVHIQSSLIVVVTCLPPPCCHPWRRGICTALVDHRMGSTRLPTLTCTPRTRRPPISCGLRLPGQVSAFSVGQTHLYIADRPCQVNHARTHAEQYYFCMHTGPQPYTGMVAPPIIPGVAPAAAFLPPVPVPVPMVAPVMAPSYASWGD